MERKLIIKGSKQTGKTTMLLLSMKLAIEKGLSCCYIHAKRERIIFVKSSFEKLGGDVDKVIWATHNSLKGIHVDMCYVDDSKLIVKEVFGQAIDSCVLRKQGFIYEVE